MTVGLLPDIEAVVTSYLRDAAAVAALLGDDGHVGRRLTAGRPALTVVRSGGVPALERVIDQPRIDISAWADDADAASLLCRTAVAELADVPWVAAGVFVSHALTVVPPVLLPDPVTDLSRYLATVQLTCKARTP